MLKINNRYDKNIVKEYLILNYADFQLQPFQIFLCTIVYYFLSSNKSGIKFIMIDCHCFIIKHKENIRFLNVIGTRKETNSVILIVILYYDIIVTPCYDKRLSSQTENNKKSR